MHVLRPCCCRNYGSYGGERYKKMGQDGEVRKQHRANHPGPNVDVKPSERGVPSAAGQCCAVIKYKLKKCNFCAVTQLLWSVACKPHLSFTGTC